MEDIEVIEARRGYFLCKFIVHNRVSDVDGNWHVGAMTTLIDAISAFTVDSSGEGGSVSVDFCISYYSTAKIQEEVAIEAKVVGKKGRISSVVVEVRRKANGDLIALGKQWMSSTPSANNAIGLSPMEDPFVQRCVKEVADLSKGIVGLELQSITLQGLEVIHGNPGHFLFKFIVPTQLSDVDGNWHVGAMATLIDSVGALAVYSSCQRYSVSADFCISYYSTAKIQEEVVIEAKVVGKRERLSSVVVEIRRKSNGDLIALAKQWMHWIKWRFDCFGYNIFQLNVQLHACTGFWLQKEAQDQYGWEPLLVYKTKLEIHLHVYYVV